MYAFDVRFRYMLSIQAFHVCFWQPLMDEIGCIYVLEGFLRDKPPAR